MAGKGFGLLNIPRFFGLDRKTNRLDVKDGFSIECENVYQKQNGVVSKRPGTEVMFDSDTDGAASVDEIGSATLSGTKYYFQFVAGDFQYSTSRTGAKTTISPSPAISTTNQIWWSVLDDKLFFVDGTNALRFFDGTTITESLIYQRPTVVAAAAGAGGNTYIYTVDNGLGESPAVSVLLVSKPSAATITIQGNTGPQTLVAGDIVRIYSRADTIAAASKLVATYTWTNTDVAATNAAIPTVAISDTQPQLYSELGIALNKSAPVGLVGLTEHYGRLVGWLGDFVYNSKSSNPHSWPDNNAPHEAFVYGVGLGDGEDLNVCVSYRESLFVFKNSSCVIFAGVGPDDTGNNAYAFRRLETNGIGCTSPKSAVVVGEENKNYLVFRSQNGFYATNGNEPVRIGEKIEPDLIGVTLATQFLGVAFHHKAEGIYVYFEGSPTNKTGWVLDVREDDNVLVGWFKWTGINPKCAYWDGDRFLLGTEEGYAISERVSQTSSDFADAKVEFVDSADFDATADDITVATSYSTAEIVKIRTNGTMPTGLTANTNYFVIVVSSTVIKLATSAANAQNNISINYTTAGTGIHSIVGTKAIEAFYTTNWIKFKTAAHVKKLMKPSLSFNATASSVNITTYAAYDWIEAFETVGVIIIGSQDAWGTLPWGSFVWSFGATASPRNVAIPRRKVRSIRYKFENNLINQDFNLQGIEQEYMMLRNRGNFA